MPRYSYLCDATLPEAGAKTLLVLFHEELQPKAQTLLLEEGFEFRGYVEHFRMSGPTIKPEHESFTTITQQKTGAKKGFVSDRKIKKAAMHLYIGAGHLEQLRVTAAPQSHKLPV